MPDLRDLMATTRPHTELSVHQLAELYDRAHRRDRLQRMAAGLAAAVVVVLAAVAAPTLIDRTADMLNRTRGSVERPGAVTASTPVEDQATPSAAAGVPSASPWSVPPELHEWTALDGREALERLLAVTREQQGPRLPPADGRAMRLHEVAVQEDRGDDGSNWLVFESVFVVNADGTGVERGDDAALRLDGRVTDRSVLRALVEQLRPQLEVGAFEAEIAGPDGTGFRSEMDFWSWFTDEEALDHLVSELGANLDIRLFEVEPLTRLTVDPRQRERVLAAMVEEADALEYRGVLPDLLGRAGIAFSVPFGTADRDTIHTVLFSPVDGAPLGWEHGGADLVWRAAATAELEIIDADG